MSAKENELVEAFKGVLNGFGVNHARTYSCLLSSAAKNCGEIIQDSGVCKSITYLVLKDLLEWGLVSRNNCSPASYFAVDPINAFGLLRKGKEKSFEESLVKLSDVIAESSGIEQGILVVGKGTQTKLINFNTRQEIASREIAFELRESVSRAVDKIVAKSIQQTKLI